MARFHERIVNIPLKAPLTDPESFILNPESGSGAADNKVAWRLKDIYPNIAEFRRIPTKIYTSKAIAEQEWEKVFTKTWLYAGRASDCRKPGDWFRYDIGPESIIIIRGSDNQLKAFFNVCKHRGNRLLNSDFGNGATAIACTFHSWMWNIDGDLVRATDRETFRDEALCGDLNLSRIHVGEWAGMVFICMADTPPMSLEAFLGEDLMRSVVGYKMEDWVVVKEVQVEVDVNWKAGIDAFQEIYHVHMLHPGGRGNVDDHYCQYDYYHNGHNRMIVPFGLVSHRLENRSEITPIMAGFLRDVGIDPDTYQGDIASGEGRRDMQRAKRRPDNRFGLDFSALTDGQLTDDWNFSLFPGVTLNVHAEGTLIQRFRPMPDLDPTKSIYDLTVILPKMKDGAKAPWYFGLEDDLDISGRTRPARRYTTKENTEVGPLLDEDVINFPKQRRGLRSRGITEIRFSEQEGRCQQMYAEMDLYMRDQK